MDNSFVFPVPLPVIQDGEKQKTDETISELKKQTDLMEGDSTKNQEWMKTAMVDSKEEKKQRKQETVWGKLQDKIYKQWDKIGIAKSFKWMFGKIGEMTKKLGGMMGGFLSGLFNDLMELMLFAAVDPNGGLLASFIGALIPLFLNLVFMIANVLVNVIPMIIKMVISYIPKFVEAISILFTAIVDAVPMIVDAFITAIPILWNALMKAIPKIVSALSLAGTKILDSLTKKFPILKKFTDFIGNMFSSIKSFFSFGEGNFMKGFVDNIKTSLDEMVKKIPDFIGGLLDKFKAAIEKYLPMVVDFVEKNFPILVSKITDGLAYLIENVGNILAVAIPKVIDFIWEALKYVAPMMLSMTWTLVKGILSLIPVIISALWKVFLALAPYLLEVFKFIGGILFDGLRILMLPFTWPLELGLWIYKNWNKLSKKISDVLDGLLNIIGKVFGSDIKNKIQSSLESIKNFIKSFSIGDMIRNSIAGAFNNIPGLNTIREFFSSLLNKIQNSKLGKLLSKLTGGGDKEMSAGASAIQGSLDLGERKSEFIKNALQSGQYGDSLRAAAKAQGASDELASQIEQLVGAIREQGKKEGVNVQAAAGSKDEAQLAALERIAKSVASNSKVLGSIRSSNTMEK